MAELKVTLHIIRDGKIYPIDKLSEEDKARMSERLGKVMSRYYTRHPDEFLKIGES